MPTLMQAYRERLEHKHGWEIELNCPACGHHGMPDYDGWTPSGAIRFGQRATVFANLSCPNCGSDLEEAAGDMLTEIFADVSTPPQNRRILRWFIAWVVVMPMFVALGIAAGISAGLWSSRAFIALSMLPVLVAPVILWMNHAVASLRASCACGEPAYLFMGLLGRSYCYRCSTCGRLLRLRD